jgi:hypothetical protein
MVSYPDRSGHWPLHFALPRCNVLRRDVRVFTGSVAPQGCWLRRRKFPFPAAADIPARLRDGLKSSPTLTRIRT